MAKLLYFSNHKFVKGALSSITDGCRAQSCGL